MPLNLILMGPPGAGKGTQASRLAQRLHVPAISTGDMLRDQVSRGTALGRQAKTVMDQGQLVSDDLIVAMVESRIAEPDASRAWILDGFPRTLPQAKALDRLLGTAADRKLTMAVFFRIDDAVLVERLSGRRTCSQCGAIWHVATKPTKVAGSCDNCGGALVHRTDDHPAAIQKRLQAFHEQTARPLCSYYEKQNLLRTIDADRAPEVIQEELVELMQRR